MQLAKPGEVLKIAEASYAGGIRILEITMNSAEPVSVIKAVANELGVRMVIAAGTVLDAASARQAVEAGVIFFFLRLQIWT